jgi:hypothetical protein
MGNSSKWIKYSNIKPKTMKLLEEKRNTPGHWTRQGFFFYNTPKA